MTTIGDLYFEYQIFRRDHDQSIYEILGLPNDRGLWHTVLTGSEEAKYRAILGPVKARYEQTHGHLPVEHRKAAEMAPVDYGGQEGLF